VNDMFDMGRYGVYVWTSYALFLAMLLWDGLTPWLRQRRVLRALRLRRQREAARDAARVGVA
jgi:heme exporter protein D